MERQIDGLKDRYVDENIDMWMIYEMIDRQKIDIHYIIIYRQIIKIQNYRYSYGRIDGGEDRLIYEKIDRWMGRQIDL